MATNDVGHILEELPFDDLHAYFICESVQGIPSGQPQIQTLSSVRMVPR